MKPHLESFWGHVALTALFTIGVIYCSIKLDRAQQRAPHCVPTSCELRR